MVERCNCSIEDIVCKTMLAESDWCPMLPSVLFALQTSVHSSTGFTPFCMLYNFDPVLPFEYADKLNNGLVSDDEFDDDKTTAECKPLNAIHFFLKFNLWKISTKVYLTKLVSQ